MVGAYCYVHNVHCLFSNIYNFNTMALGSTQPLTEMSIRNTSWG
jgi:hypothetical protein